MWGIVLKPGSLIIKVGVHQPILRFYQAILQEVLCKIGQIDYLTVRENLWHWLRVMESEIVHCLSTRGPLKQWLKM